MRGRDAMTAPVAAVSHETEYTRALYSLRARDARADSVRTERLVADRINASHASIVARHARRQRETSSMAAPEHLARTHEHVRRRAVEGRVTLGDDTTTFADDHRNQATPVRAQPLRTSQMALSEHDAQWRREGPATLADGHQMPILGAAARALRDDGSLFASHAPPPGGPERRAVTAEDERATREMLHLTPTMRRTAMTNAPHRPPPASFQQRGTRR